MRTSCPSGPSSSRICASVAAQVRMRAAARRRRLAGGEQRVERLLARRPDVERDLQRRRRDAVEHDAAHAVAVAAQVLVRDARAVAAAPQVPARIAERLRAPLRGRRPTPASCTAWRRCLSLRARRTHCVARGSGSARAKPQASSSRLERGARRAATCARCRAGRSARRRACARTSVSRAANGASDVAAWPGPPARMTSGSGFGDSVFAGSTATKSVMLRPSGLLRSSGTSSVPQCAAVRKLAAGGTRRARASRCCRDRRRRSALKPNAAASEQRTRRTRRCEAIGMAGGW